MSEYKSQTELAHRRMQITKYVELYDMLSEWNRFPGKRRVYAWDKLDEIDKDIYAIQDRIINLMGDLVKSHEPFSNKRKGRIFSDPPMVKLQDRIERRAQLRKWREYHGNKTMDSKKVEKTPVEANQQES